MDMALNFKQPITTRYGSEIKFYEVYSDKIHGAWLDDDDAWKICSWSLPNGYCIYPKMKNDLDLINNEPYKKET